MNEEVEDRPMGSWAGGLFCHCLLGGDAGVGVGVGSGGGEGVVGCGRTKEYLQGVGMQLQVLRLLLHHVHVLRVLVVEAVHTGIGQHLWEPKSALSLLNLSLASLPAPFPPFPPEPLAPSPVPIPCPHLAGLLQSPAGVTEEGEGSGGRHLVDGRQAVPQAQGELLCRGEVDQHHRQPSPPAQNNSAPTGLGSGAPAPPSTPAL